MKKHITIILLGLFLGSLIGCNVSPLRDDLTITERKEQIKAQMTENLSSKYNEKFTVSLPYIMAGTTFQEDRWMESEAYLNSNPDETFKIIYDIEKDLIYDDYEPIIYLNDLTKEFQGIVSMVYPNAKVSLEIVPYGSCDSTEAHSSLNEYLEYDSPKLITRIYIPIDLYKDSEEIEKAQKFINKIYANSNLYGELHFIYLDKNSFSQSVEELSEVDISDLKGNSHIKDHKYIYIQQDVTDKKIIDTFKDKEDEKEE